MLLARARFIAFLALAAASAACASTLQEDYPTSPSAPPARPYGDIGGLSDGQVMEIQRATDEFEMALVDVTRRKATDERVRQLADAMGDAHTKFARGREVLSSRLGLELKGSAPSREVKSDGRALVNDLDHRTPGPELDRLLVDAQINLHERAIATIDHMLLPEAEQPEVIEWLRRHRPALAAHLDQAKQLRASLP